MCKKSMGQDRENPKSAKMVCTIIIEWLWPFVVLRRAHSASQFENLFGHHFPGA